MKTAWDCNASVHERRANDDGCVQRRWLYPTTMQACRTATQGSMKLGATGNQSTLLKGSVPTSRLPIGPRGTSRPHDACAGTVQWVSAATPRRHSRERGNPFFFRASHGLPGISLVRHLLTRKAHRLAAFARRAREDHRPSTWRGFGPRDRRDASPTNARIDATSSLAKSPSAGAGSATAPAPETVNGTSVASTYG